MKLERRHAVLFLAIAAWNVFSYANFARNLFETASSGEDRPTGYYVAHTVLIVVNLLIAVILAVLGRRAWRATSHRGSRNRVA
jgi:glucan phosphoethanolaminetransferase (alkaline phosphatase superfamily)